MEIMLLIQAAYANILFRHLKEQNIQNLNFFINIIHFMLFCKVMTNFLLQI